MPIKIHQNDELPALNLTAMIDVLFLLIIFFVLGTKFSDSERSIRLDVPTVSAKGALTPPPAKKVVNVYRDGQITLDRQSVTLEELGQRLADARREYKKQGVLVRGDGTVSFQTVANVLAACRQAGIPDLAIAVRLTRASNSNELR
jgi:biopolymer transport protein ExbD